MTDEKKEIQNKENPTKTGSESEYVGPPKSHEFKDNNNQEIKTSTKARILSDPSRPDLKFPVPQEVSPDINIDEIDESTLEIDEDSILMKHGDFKGDGGSNELLRAIVAEDPTFVVKEDVRKGGIKGSKGGSNAAKKKSFDAKAFQKELEEKLKKLWEKRKIIKEFYEKNIKYFHALNVLWMIAKSVFYSIGLAFFIVCLFFFISFNSLIRSYLNKKGLENVTFGRIEHSLSGFVFHDIREKNGLFSINSIKAQYSFADLLEKKIPFVGVDTLKIYIQEGENAKNTSQELTKILLSLGIFDKNSLFSINSLHFENSVLYVGNKEYKLPVSFSGVGSLEATKHFLFPITLKNEYVKLNANVELDIASSSSTWKMEIVSGSLTLPNIEEKNLTGTATLKTANGTFNSINFAGQLKDDESTKEVSIYASKNANSAWSIRVNLAVPQKGDPTTYLLSLSNVLIGKDWKSFKSESPISLKVSNFQYDDFKADEIKVSGRGSLNCALDGCTYVVKEKSDIILFSPSYTLYETNFSVNYPIYIEVLPTKEAALTLRADKLLFDIRSAASTFALRKKSGVVTNQPTDVSINNSHIKGSFSLEDKSFNADVLINYKEINDTNFRLANGNVHFSLNKGDLTTRIVSQRARLKTFDYFKPEVNLVLDILPNNYFDATVKSDKNNLSITADGYYNPYSLNASVAIQTTTPIVFGEDQPLPQDVSSFFSEHLRNVSGSVSIKGMIHYKDLRSISGPLKVLIDDASFTYGNTTVKGLSTVLNISQIVPFGAQGVQNIYAEEVTNILPFTNANAQVFFDAGRKQFNFSSLSIDVAGYSLLIDPMWYSYTSPVYTFNFKGRPVLAQSIVDATTLKDVQIKGNASVNLSLQMEGPEFSLKSFEFLIPSDGTIYYTPSSYPHSYLENLKQLDFRRLSIYLTEQDKENELIFSSENKANKVKKKTSFRMKVEEPLPSYIKEQKIIVPNFVKEEKGSF
ncbi:MAG: hypothetical protein J6Y03_06235 [Alphaproteobacteria bacterium]|nr:hypothetical protein [Alphaproteobacteria bacterium]